MSPTRIPKTSTSSARTASSTTHISSAHTGPTDDASEAVTAHGSGPDDLCLLAESSVSTTPAFTATDESPNTCSTHQSSNTRSSQPTRLSRPTPLRKLP